MKYLNNKGFTLVELLVAITILTIGLLAVAGLQTTAIRGNSFGNTISQATGIAESRIEEIRNSDYFAIPAFAGTDVVDTSYSRETQIEPDVPLADLTRVTVTVRWQANGPHQVVLRTIVANGGE